MTLTPRTPAPAKTGFRWQLLLAMMAVVAGVTAIAIYIANRNLAAEVSASLRREFEQRLADLHQIQEIRHAVLTERCRALARKPRIHAALEDNALDLLYPSARDELRDILAARTSDPLANGLHAQFYRFLDSTGAVLSPPDPSEVGGLAANDEAKLALKTQPKTWQLGYLPVRPSGAESPAISEIIAVPIFSSETGEPIASLVLGFKPLRFDDPVNSMKSGIWVEGSMHAPGVEAQAQGDLEKAVAASIVATNQNALSFQLKSAAATSLAFTTRLNPNSLYPPAYDVSIFPLAGLAARQEKLRWQILSVAALMLAAGFLASHYLARKLSKPVEELAVDSARQKAGRQQAEAALEQTSVELQRSVRFSADASHQLKTPVTVMRAGLEELLARDDLSPDLRREIDNLIHQSFRLTGVVDDLLLLSRMDAGRLILELGPVDLSLLIDGELDDLSAQPNPLNIEVESAFPKDIQIQGEKRYTTMIVRNLLENARKYNQPGGSVRVNARQGAESIDLSITNSGRPIPPPIQQLIFERFHRGAVGENVPGHGLGLNLARELARLHGGDLWLARSDADATEFIVRFRLAAALSRS